MEIYDWMDIVLVEMLMNVWKERERGVKYCLL